MKSTIAKSDAARDAAFRRLLSGAEESGSLIPLLQKTQGLYGYLPERALVRIARRLRLSPAQVYGVATFYGQFRLRPAGRHLVTVCHGTACHVAGAERISEALEGALGIRTGGTTPDGLFTLRNVACLGCCSLAPVMMVGETAHGRLTPAKAKAVLRRRAR
ncbi:MAG: NADH-quinone oxidoreductase subunit NuoE [bacterium]|nr:NADH-quinone oxidoreductase subunit NuoE [bacterium]